jgi:hypothetical protein
VAFDAMPIPTEPRRVQALILSAALEATLDTAGAVATDRVLAQLPACEVAE